MAVEETHAGDVRRYSNEKADIEKVEQISEVSHTPNVLENGLGEAVAITWKTWAVIFVSRPPPHTHEDVILTVDRSCLRLSAFRSGLFQQPQRSKANFPSCLTTHRPWPGIFPLTQLAMQSASLSLVQTLISSVDDCSYFLETSAAVSGSSSQQLHQMQHNSRPD